MRAFKCDRCGKLNEGGPAAHLSLDILGSLNLSAIESFIVNASVRPPCDKYHNLDEGDLCIECARKIVVWYHNTSIVNPGD